MKRELTWVETAPNLWATSERVDGEPAFVVSRTMHGWLLSPRAGRRFDHFASADDAKTFADNFEDRPAHLR
jgi:hypothetical protein